MKKITIYILTFLAVGLTGCNFLDKNPDARASIDTKKKVQLLLVSAYTHANWGTLCEFSSDQVVDNNAPDKVGHTKSMNSFDRLYDEMFGWETIKADGNQDSPEYIWDNCYSAIATCNQALQAIEELEAQGYNMDAEKGEALVSRAYHHYILANIFCHAWKDENLSKQDLGITYMKEPETTVAPHYERGSLYDTYAAIEKDLEEGIPLIDDSYYGVAKYHFNSKAAHAFAAQFYLFKREYAKVISHADQVLSTDDANTLGILYDAQKGRDLGDPVQEQKVWIDPTASYNLLLYTTYTWGSYSIYPSYGRYQYNGDASDYTTLCDGPCWSRIWPGFPLWMYSQEYGCFCSKFMSFWEYQDKVNGYGVAHGVTRAFTTNETLLCRAEAKTMLNDLDGAANDLRMWAQSYKGISGRMDTLDNGTVDLSVSKINSFYRASSHKNFAPELHNTDMSPEFIVSAEQKPLIHCVLHFRRIETLHDGLRWLDIKRYGIEITHQRGTEPLRTLVWNDDRRAIQLPQKVLVAGMTKNPRVILGDNVNKEDATTVALPQDNNPTLNIAFPNFGTNFTMVNR